MARKDIKYDLKHSSIAWL